MIFKHGFVHCDAHPGNIFVRRKPARKNKNANNPYANNNQNVNMNPDDYQIVLLDHGLYRALDPQFIKDFSHFWISLIKFDKKNLQIDAKKLNI